MILFPVAVDRAALFSSLGLVAALLLSRVGETTEEAGRFFAAGATLAVAVGLVLLGSAAVTVHGQRPQWICARTGWQGIGLLLGWGAACLAFAIALVGPSGALRPLLATGLLAYLLGAVAGVRRSP